LNIKKSNSHSYGRRRGYSLRAKGAADPGVTLAGDIGATVYKNKKSLNCRLSS